MLWFDPFWCELKSVGMGVYGMGVYGVGVGMGVGIRVWDGCRDGFNDGCMGWV